MTEASSCPHCGEALRDGSGKVRRTATAAALGLAAATSAAACDEPVDEYGPAPTGPTTTTTTSTAGGMGGEAGAGGLAVPEYGPAPTGGGGAGGN